MKKPSGNAWGAWAAAVVTLASVATVAEAQPAVPEVESGRFDRCSMSSDAVRLLAMQSRYRGSEGFDARACPPGFNVDDIPEISSTGGGGHGLALRGNAGLAFFMDKVDSAGHALIYTPSFLFSARDIARGWQATASYTAYVGNSASPDIIASASAVPMPVRHVGTLAVEAGVGPVRLSLDGGISVESGLLGTHGGASASIDLHDRRITPMLAYHFDADTLGVPGTPFDVFSREELTHTIDAGASIRVNLATALIFAGTTSFGTGDAALSGNYVPIFSQEVAGLIAQGATAEEVNYYRLNISLQEQLPASRERFAFLERVVHRFETATLRFDERLYLDTWGLKASTTDVRSWHDVSGALRVGLHARLHAQTGADFWRRVYVADLTGQGIKLPVYRTIDTELGPLVAVTAGGGLRWVFSRIFALNVLAEGSYTEILEALFTTHRWGFFSGASLELRVE